MVITHGADDNKITENTRSEEGVFILEDYKQRTSEGEMMENSPPPMAMAPLLLWNLLTSIFIYADKFKPFQTLAYFLVSSFLFFLRLLPSVFPSLNPFYFFKPPQSDNRVPATFRGGGSGKSCIARALSQLLSIMNEVPVNSRKYQLVKSLAEKLIAENILEDCEALSEVNRTVLLAAFSRTLGLLEVAAMVQEGDIEGGTVSKPSSYYYVLNRVYRTVRYYGDAWTRLGKLKSELDLPVISAEKLSAELLWLAEKMAACGCAEEAVARWASATKLAWLALSAGSRLQGSLVKVSAFLFKQAKEMGSAKCEESKIEEQRKIKLKILISWLPFLCRATGGVDTPVLSLNEKAELERVLDEMVQSLLEEEEQEKVLSLWLHHFTHCPSSDWPNLHSCYERWCIASRKLLIFTATENIIKTSP